MSVCLSVPSSPVCPMPSNKKIPETKNLLNKVVTHTLRVTKIHSAHSEVLGKAKPNYAYKIIKPYQLLRVGPKQLYALAHLRCTHASGTWYFLVIFRLCKQVYFIFFFTKSIIFGPLQYLLEKKINVFKIFHKIYHKIR